MFNFDYIVKTFENAKGIKSFYIYAQGNINSFGKMSYSQYKAITKALNIESKQVLFISCSSAECAKQLNNVNCVNEYV